MPFYAKEAGARLIIVNLTPTPLDHLAEIVMLGRAGELMMRLVERVGARVVR